MTVELIAPETEVQPEKVVEVLGEYEAYQAGWVANFEIDCARVVRRADGYYVIPFGEEPDGFYYEDEGIGPFPTKAEAHRQAEMLLEEEKKSL